LKWAKEKISNWKSLLRGWHLQQPGLRRTFGIVEVVAGEWVSSAVDEELNESALRK